MFNLSPLSYNFNSLEPHISSKTMELHYSKHHQAYVDKLNKLIEGTELEDKNLMEIINESFGKNDKKDVFNNAGQHYNHEIFWQSLRPTSSDYKIPAELENLIIRDFSSLNNLLEEFKKAASEQFGSGWIWLALSDSGLKVLKTSNAEPVFLQKVTPLLAIDIWEHSYYLDYQNKRLDFVEAVFHNLLNWEFASKQANL